MKVDVLNMLMRIIRVTSLIVIAALGTIALMRFAPGYFTDIRELDGQYADGAREALRMQEGQERSTAALTQHLLRGWLHGDMGISRQFGIPVTDLIGDRLKITAKLLACGVGCGWLIAVSLALLLSTRQTRGGEALIAGPVAILLAVPIGAMATACFSANTGGPAVVLTTVIAVRDFKLVYKLFRQARLSGCIFHARAQGISQYRIMWVYLLPALISDLFALATMSFVVALSAMVPVEVVFDVPGLGQLAWSAAMNRDLPVLLAVTVLIALCVGTTSMLANPRQRMDIA
jgi:peptide/nickel transport system permease protein